MRLALTACLFACVSGLASAQDLLEPARALYASADYEGALSAFGRLKNAETGSTVSVVEIDRYRVLCLVALGRAEEADQVIESILTHDPLYELAPADAPPRIRAAFSQVRRRVLPGIVRGLYVEAKAAYDRKAFSDAVQKMEKTLHLLQTLDAADQPALADLRTLATGFRDLSLASLPPAPVEATAPSNAEAITERSGAGVVQFTDPVVRRQVLPPWMGVFSGTLLDAEFRGTIEVEIDERGDVVGATITQPIHALYDASLLRAARDWKYEPARANGRPVKVNKRVEVVLRPR